jgi:hypothetical protein
MKTQTYGKFLVESGSGYKCCDDDEERGISGLEKLKMWFFFDYYKNRFNTTDMEEAIPLEIFNPKCPRDGIFTWFKGSLDNEGDAHGVYNSATEWYEFEARYDEGPSDQEFMKEQDIKYLKQLLSEDRLQEVEPDVWRMREMDRAQDMDIGEW